MKTLYFFRPNGHWNVTSKEAHDYLKNFYGAEFFKTEEVKDD